MSVRSELAKLKTLMPGPIQIGSSYVTYERRLSWVMRGMRGDPAVLNLLRLNPGVRSLAPDSRDRLIEVVRALWIDDPQPPPAKAVITPKTSEVSPPPPPPTLKPIPVVVPAPTSQQMSPPPEPPPPAEPSAPMSGWFELMTMLGANDGLLPSERAASAAVTVTLMEHQYLSKPPDLVVTEAMRKPDVVWLRTKIRVRFQNSNNCNQWWEADPLARQPQAAPAWVKQDENTWRYALRVGLEEV